MELDKWIGPYKVRAFLWTDGKLIYFNVCYYAPGQSLEKPPMLDQTVYITNDKAGQRLVFEFTHTLVSYVAELPARMAQKGLADFVGKGNKLVISVKSGPPSLLIRPEIQRRHRNEPER